MRFNTLKKEQNNSSGKFYIVSSALLQQFFTSNSAVFVDRGRKNISCPRAQDTLADTPLGVYDDLATSGNYQWKLHRQYRYWFVHDIMDVLRF